MAVGQVASVSAPTQPVYPGYQQTAYQIPATSAVSSASYLGAAGYGQTAYPTYGAPAADMSSYASGQFAYSNTTTTTQVIAESLNLHCVD